MRQFSLLLALLWMLAGSHVTATGGSPMVVHAAPFWISVEVGPFLPLPDSPSRAEEDAEGKPLPVAQEQRKVVNQMNAESPPQQVTGSPERVPERGSRGHSGFGVWEILRAGGTVGVIIIVLSLIAGALIIEQLVTLRKAVLMPQHVMESLSEKLALRDAKGLMKTCADNPCVLTDVLRAGMAEWESEWHQVEKAIEDSITEQTARLLRKVEYLSLIGNLAPMLGLLGTVVGMILAFRTVAETQGAARAADLAEAIYLALITTVEGLIVAIPSLAAYAYFRNRVDELMAEVAVTVQQLLTPLRRRRVPAKPATNPPVPPSGAVP